MSTVLSHFDCPSSILTPSTIQCTKFYTNNNTDNINDNLFEHIKRYTALITPSSSISSSLASLASSLPPIKLSNRHSETFTCLDKQLAENLQQWLPSRISILSTWSLLYSLDQHGASLSTLYRNCANNGPCLLVIQNTEDEVFGAYLSEGFQPQQSYYGNGECFLWRSSKKKKQVDIYPWTSHNDYLMYSNHDFLAIGGGKGHFGLWLDLTHGYSEPCMTFNNPSLASKSSFECLAIEIWCFAY